MPRTKKQKLEAMLLKRNIRRQIEYWNRRPFGWMIQLPCGPQRLGYDFDQAVDMIESGTLDFLAEDKNI